MDSGLALSWEDAQVLTVMCLLCPWKCNRMLKTYMFLWVQFLERPEKHLLEVTHISQLIIHVT